jgi:hypothetical protein
MYYLLTLTWQLSSVITHQNGFVVHGWDQLVAPSLCPFLLVVWMVGVSLLAATLLYFLSLPWRWLSFSLAFRGWAALVGCGSILGLLNRTLVRYFLLWYWLPPWSIMCWNSGFFEVRYAYPKSYVVLPWKPVLCTDCCSIILIAGEGVSELSSDCLAVTISLKAGY